MKLELSDIEWHLEERKISQLKENPNNPRILTDDQYSQLRTSIMKFGIIDKPVINTDGMIIGGHQRLKIFKSLTIKSITCWIPNRTLTDEEVSELNIRHNRNQGEWDWDILANNFEPADLYEWGFSLESLQIDPLDEEEKESKPKKKKACPNCGHEF